MVCYAEKQEKSFWFSSLDQIVHFDAIIFCRTFVELFWSVRVDRKKKSHYNSRVSLHEAPTKKEFAEVMVAKLSIVKIRLMTSLHTSKLEDVVLEQVTLKPQLQAHNCLTSWLQKYGTIACYGEIVSKRATT